MAGENEKLKKAGRNSTNIRAALLTPGERGVEIESNGASTRTPAELGKEKDQGIGE